MEAVIFIGLQGAGKSTFYRERFFHTHVRLSLDMLKTRHRERRLLLACVEALQPFAVDNTNPSRSERQVYIEAARVAGFRVVGYYFQSRVEDCLRRKYPRTPHLLGSKGTDDDKHLGEAESLRFVADGSLIAEEKIDGTNVGIHFAADGKMALQCRGHLITEGMHP